MPDSPLPALPVAPVAAHAETGSAFPATHLLEATRQTQHELDMFIRMIGCMAVIMVVSFVMTRMWLRRRERPGISQLLGVGVVFGFVSMYGTLGGYNYGGLFLNLRDMGPLIGGLFFGPVTGLVAAAIGSTHRVMVGLGQGSVGAIGDSTIPCAIATIIAGVVGSIGWRLAGRRAPTLRLALPVALFMSVLHIGIVFAYDAEMGAKFFGKVWWLWILFYAWAMGSYVYAAVYLAHEREIELGAQVMEKELTIARDIQRDILPNVFPPFPDRPEIDLHAYLAPAREVGGDFYDFFMLDDRRLLVLVGDVSGKGVPAALFMAVTRTMLRSKDWRDRPIGDVIGEVNDELSAGNNEAMFVTLFAAAVHLDTGVVEFVNGGHNPPLVRRAGTDELVWLREPVGLVLGVMPGFAFEGAAGRLAPGDLLVVYTDGVTEAERPDRGQYGEDRLAALVGGLPADVGASACCDAVVADVGAFVRGAPPSDDLTLLCLRYRGPSDDSTPRQVK